MRNSLSIGALVGAALISAAASATEITVGKSATLVIDVEFWGREQLEYRPPEDPESFIISYGDPVHGLFRIWADDAPAPTRTPFYRSDMNVVVYGSDVVTPENPLASFITSHLFTPLPDGLHDVAPFSGSTANDYVHIGDGLPLYPGEPLQDVIDIADSFAANFRQEGQTLHRLIVTQTTPYDMFQGLALDQEFDLSTPVESGDAGYGWMSSSVNRVIKGFDFVVERLRVSKHLVCRP